jgi:hypothetical protein
MTSSGLQPWRSSLAEIALIFAVFFIQGAWPAPDVNEPCYLGKAIHYWNPHWIENDFFLDSADTQRVFCFAFGWLSLGLAPATLAWVGRIAVWALLAWSWRRLSVALVPRPWFSVLSAALFAYLMERGHMAGEWVIGGVEAKGFAYVFVFLGLEALVCDRWNRGWLCLGAAACFHVLVGGWAAVAASFAWFWLGRQRPPLRSMWPGLVGGFVLSLPGLVPSLLLDWGADAQTVRQAHEIYVYKRLAHHLVFTRFPPEFIGRFLALVGGLVLLARAVAQEGGASRIRAFAIGCLGIASIGVVLGLVGEFDPTMAAGLLRYYWFRLSDAAVPLGVALLAALWIGRMFDSRSPHARRILAAIVVICAVHLGAYAFERPSGMAPRGDKRVQHPEWRLVCDWIRRSPLIPPKARFLNPMESQTFKWRTGRAEVVTRKDLPQDARAIVEWWRRLEEIHGTQSDDPENQWHASLTELGAERLRQLGAKYGARYLLTEAEPRLPLELLYANRVYAVYRLSDGEQP